MLRPERALDKQGDLMSRQSAASQRAILALVLLCAGALLLLSALGRSLWIDEHFSVAIALEPTVGAALDHIVETERRPPLFYLSLYAWVRVAGSADLALRLPSILWGLVTIALTARLARGLGIAAWPSALLLAASPFMLLFAPMIRPYSMTTALSLATALAFLQWYKGDAAALRWYVLWGALLIWTDYSGMGTILAFNLFALLAVPRRRWLAWLAAQIGLIVLYIPWLSVAVSHATAGSTVEADLAGGMMGFALKLAYPVLSFSIGETIFPWDVRGAAGMLAFGALVLAGMRRRWALAPRANAGDGSHTPALFLLVGILVPFLFIVFLFTFLIRQGTFVLIPSRAMSVFPLVIIVVAAGLASLSRRWRVAAGFLLLLAWGGAFANLLAGTHYHNPIYAVRMRELAALVQSNVQPGDLVLSDQDSLFFYYYSHPNIPNVMTDAADLSRRLDSAQRVWLLTLGRDRTRVGAPAVALIATLEQQRWREQQSWRSGPEDETYRRVKETLLKRPDFEYKALLRLYGR